jgi:hypothetical protein
LRTTIGWAAANLVCELFGLLHPKNYVRIRYEDLVQKPRETIHQISTRLASRPRAELEARTGNNRHQLYGNAVRFRPASLASLQEDSAWKSAMPQSYRGLAALSWPLAAKYGYFKS